MPGPTFAAGETVTLCTVEEEDLDFIETHRNDPAVRRPLTLNRAANGEQIREFFENAISEDDSASLVVCVDSLCSSTERASGETASSARERSASGDTADTTAAAVGMVALFEEDDVAGTATIAYWIAPDEQRNGYATEGVDLLCEHAFADRRLNKLRADVLEWNDGSRRVLEKVGFEREGTLREEKFVGGSYVDVYRYGLLADEWGGR